MSCKFHKAIFHAVLGAVKKNRGEEPLQRRDIKYTISMVVLDIVASIPKMP